MGQQANAMSAPTPYRTLTLGDRRVKGSEVRRHGEAQWRPCQRWLLGHKLRKDNLAFGDFRAPLGRTTPATEQH